jgi:hypothetical protein
MILYQVETLFASADGRTDALSVTYIKTVTTGSYEYKFSPYLLQLLPSGRTKRSKMPLPCIVLVGASLVQYSITDDDDQANRRDDDGRRYAKAEVAPEGEVVPEELRPSRLLANDQVRG